MKTKEYTQAKAAWEEIRAEIKRIDSLLDDESLSDSEYDVLDSKLAQLIKQEGKAYQLMDKLDGDVLKKASPWLAGFLGSFDTGTRKITLKQAHVFQEIDSIETVNGAKTFWFNGKRFHAEMPNYWAGFSTLIVSK